MTIRYAIDVHGTLADRTPDGGVAPSHLFPLLTGLMRAWVKHGEEVFILSGPPSDVILNEITSLGLVHGVHYTGVLSMVDHIKATGVEMWEEPVGSGNWWTSREVWHSVKGEIAKGYQIDVVVDDTEAYRPAMPATTSFVLVNPCEPVKG